MGHPHYQYMYMHSNRLMMVGLPRDHFIFQQGYKITRVEVIYTHGEGLDVKGKKKRGGLKVETEKPFCRLSLESGQEVLVMGGIWGSVIEVNQRVVDRPALLHEDPEGEGFLALINAGHHADKKIDRKYLDQAAYASRE